MAVASILVPAALMDLQIAAVLLAIRRVQVKLRKELYKAKFKTVLHKIHGFGRKWSDMNESSLESGEAIATLSASSPRRECTVQPVSVLGNRSTSITAMKPMMKPTATITALLISIHSVYYAESFISRSGFITRDVRRRQNSRVISAFEMKVVSEESTLDVSKIQQRLRSMGLKDSKVEVLSHDPVIYKVLNLLTAKECLAYQSYVATNKNMTRSNAPEVSLQLSKLWPLPILALGSGIPPYLRLEDHSSLERIVSAVVPNIMAALTCMGILAYAVVLPLVRNRSQSSSRTSVAVALNQESDMEFCRDLVQRVSLATLHPWSAWEAPVVTRYDRGGIFARHGDASPTGGSEWEGQGGQRVMTCICYLNTLEKAGGETYFDQLDIAVQPVQGSALFFVPADSKTWKADDRMTHESVVATKEKWIVQLFGRAERVPPPLGLPDTFEALLTAASETTV